MRGERIHHGLWIRGDESKQTAQVQLIEHLAQAAEIAPGARILDVGCGFGATSIYLARKVGAAATGIAISQVQVKPEGTLANDRLVQEKRADTARAQQVSAAPRTCARDLRRGIVYGLAVAKKRPTLT